MLVFHDISLWPGTSLTRNTSVFSFVSTKLVHVKRKDALYLVELDQNDLGERKEERQKGPRGRQRSKTLIVWEAYEAKMVQQVKRLKSTPLGIWSG